MPTRGLMRKCQPPARQEFPGGIERGTSQNNAVPGQGDGKDAVTKDEILPLEANGGTQLLDTRSLTLICPR